MISVVMPTKGRPDQARACVERLFETTRGQNVECIVVTPDLADFDGVGLEEHVLERVTLIRCDEPGPMPAWNAGLRVALGEWLVTGADDLHWCEGWLEAALAHEREGFCGLYDGHTDPSERATHFLLSRTYIIEHQGGDLMPPYYKSWYPDVEISEVARRAGLYVCPVEARVEHHHPDWKDAPDDATYQAGRQHHAEDRRTFYRRQRFGFPDQAVEWGEDVRPIIGVPLERTVPYADETFWAFIAIAQQGYPFIQLPYTRVDVARNKFAMHVLNSDFTHLVMLDLDHDHRHDVVKRLVRRVEQDRKRLVVSGLNFRRGQPYEPIAFVVQDGETYSVADWEPNAIMSVDMIGCSTCIVAREVFEQLPGPPWFWNDYRGAAIDNWPGEDITFSGLCRQHGIELWVDAGISSDHLIDGRVNEAVYRAYQEMEAKRNT
jgi:glycosyltransferase involved in cell wall biosynthesis